MTMNQMKARAEQEIRRIANNMFRWLIEGNVAFAQTVNTALLTVIMSYTTINLLTMEECNEICNEVEAEVMKRRIGVKS